MGKNWRCNDMARKLSGFKIVRKYSYINNTEVLGLKIIFIKVAVAKKSAIFHIPTRLPLPESSILLENA